MTPQPKRVLDVCCGSRMFWYDRKNTEAVFMDKRSESHQLADKNVIGGLRELHIAPDFVGDFTRLIFDDCSFPLVVFDPPHLLKVGAKSWLARKYGKLNGDWETELTKGFAECFRVLKPDGTLIFKWNETDIPVSKILTLTPVAPLFGNRGGKAAKSHWIVFMKPR